MTFLATPLTAILGYLDPGSGSFLLQLAIATLVGLVVVLRTQWAKIRSFFGGKSHTPEDEDSDDEQP